MEKLHYKIKANYDQFSKSLKKVAKHVLMKPESFAVHSAYQVATEIDVSETTVLRFCQALGYKGYSSFQRVVQDELLNKKSSLYEYQLLKNELKSDQQFSKRMMIQDSEVIMKTADKIDGRDFASAVDALIAADKILVSGVRASHAMAHWLSFSLNVVRGNVQLLRQDTDDLILLLSEMNERSVFVAISFHRYAVETINLAKVMKEKGAFVIGITDTEVAPLREYADILFTVQLPVMSTLDVAPAVFSLMNALVGAVTVKTADNFEKRTKLYEELSLEHFFVE